MPQQPAARALSAIGVAACAAALSGCMWGSRDPIMPGGRETFPDAITERLEAQGSATTREQVLLALGEPDFVREDGRLLVYFSRADDYDAWWLLFWVIEDRRIDNGVVALRFDDAGRLQEWMSGGWNQTIEILDAEDRKRGRIEDGPEAIDPSLPAILLRAGLRERVASRAAAGANAGTGPASPPAPAPAADRDAR